MASYKNSLLFFWITIKAQCLNKASIIIPSCNSAYFSTYLYDVKIYGTNLCFPDCACTWKSNFIPFYNVRILSYVDKNITQVTAKYVWSFPIQTFCCDLSACKSARFWCCIFAAETFLPILFIVFLCVYGIRMKCMSTKKKMYKWQVGRRKW